MRILVIDDSEDWRELTEAGHGGDVALAAQTDVSDAAPVLTGGVLA